MLIKTLDEIVSFVTSVEHNVLFPFLSFSLIPEVRYLCGCKYSDLNRPCSYSEDYELALGPPSHDKSQGFRFHPHS